MSRSEGVKLGEVLKTFDGADEVESWLVKMELVARLRNIKDEATLINSNVPRGRCAGCVSTNE